MKRIDVILITGAVLSVLAPASAQAQRRPPPEPPEPAEAPEPPEPVLAGDDDDCMQFGHWDDDDDERAKRPARTSAKVKGPVHFEIELINADLEISTSSKDEVSVSAKNCGPGDLYLEGDVDEFTVEFDPSGSCESPVIVKLPPGSSVEVDSVEGGIKLKGTYKKVALSAVSGDVEVEAADEARVEAVNGKINLKKVTRSARIESVSGDVTLVTTGSAPSIKVETVSGDFRWTGVCGKDCQLKVESFQGNVELGFDKTSSFGLKFASESGQFTDKLGMTGAGSGKKNVSGRSPSKATFGKGEGTVRVETYQGNLTIKPR